MLYYLPWEKAGNPRNWRRDLLGSEEADRIASLVQSPLLMVRNCEWTRGIIAFYEAFTKGNPERARTPEEISPILLAVGLATEKDLGEAVKVATNQASWIFDMGIIPAMKYMNEPWKRSAALTNGIPLIRPLLSFQLHPHIHISTGKWEAEISPYCSGN